MAGDINLWQLTYGDTDLPFGLHDTGHPFTSQPVIGPANIDVGDDKHPLSDGVVFGVDHTRGRTIKFSGVHLDYVNPKVRRWERRLDAAGVFEAAWSFESHRRVPGAVARLDNVDRERGVYGRPRRYAPDLAKIRHGWLPWVGDFDTVDDRFYGPEQTAELTGITSTGGGLFPLPSDDLTLTNDGTRDAFVRLTINGYVYNPMVTAYDEEDDLVWWSGLAVDMTDLHDDIGGPGLLPPTAVIDSRPWARAVTIVTDHRPGTQRGMPLDRLVVPAGRTYRLGFYSTLDSGADPDTATLTAAWCDTYGSL